MGSMRNFNIFISMAKVVSIPMHGMSFTWSNNRESESWTKLDRFLLYPMILVWFPKLVQRGLHRSLLNHNAIVVGESEADWGHRPFRFFNGWLEDKEMMLEGLKASFFYPIQRLSKGNLRSGDED